MNDVDFVSEFVDRLLFGLVNAQIYGPSHARVRLAAEQAASRVARYGVENSAPSVVVAALGDRIVFEGRPVLGATLFGRRLLQRIAERGCGGLEFRTNVTADDVAGLLEALAKRGDVPKNVSEANLDLTTRNVRGIRFLPPAAGGGDGAGGRDDGASGGGPAASLIALHQNTVDLLQTITIGVCQGRDLEIGQVGSLVEGIISGLKRDAGALHAMAHYPEHDFFTFGHSIRVGLLALDVARRTSDDPALLVRIGTAALLHDVGKSLISWEVLHKRGALTPDERREMQRHPVLGATILLSNRESDPLAVSAAYGHHCTLDGSGYPRTCDEFHQGIVTRLVKICDCYEALTATRPYKAAMTPPRAFRVMLDMKGQFDEDLLRHFIRSVGVHPVGSHVKLDDGSAARVVAQTDDFHRPVVEVVERDGGPVPPAERRPYDLSAPQAGGPTVVVADLPSPGASSLVA